MGYILLGSCPQCGQPIYSFDTYVIERFHISCQCIGSIMLEMGVPHINQLPMPFEDFYDEEIG